MSVLSESLTNVMLPQLLISVHASKTRVRIYPLPFIKSGFIHVSFSHFVNYDIKK